MIQWETFMSLYRDYLKMAGVWEGEFARNKRQYGEKILCRKGCSDCCSQLFQITEIEAAYISRAVKKLPAEDQEKLKDRARKYLPQRDRKSTRLNSSHLVISYAVFCLKKKKKIQLTKINTQYILHI